MEVKATVVPYLPQSFLFNWDPLGQAPPIPTTPQCETINITWGREGASNSPNPVAPYILQVYTSTSTVPFIIPAGSGLSFDWAVPFLPGTQYQICMFDSQGNTGGCQASYTVIPPLSTPNCTNVTSPPPLGVEGTVDNGLLSQFGWIDQCTDISILPTNGTPPYTLTIAPALHSPYNLTSNDMSSINWTDSLGYASEFYIGVYDSAGNMWSNGPLHSGDGGTTGCLTGNDTLSPGFIQPVVAVGAGIGGLVIGLLIGMAVAFLLVRRYYKKKMPADLASLHGSPPNFHYRSIPTSGISHPTHVSESSFSGLRFRASSQYQVEPFVMPDENGLLVFSDEARSTGDTVTTPPPPPEPASSPSATQQQGHVYVLHHDSNIPPVTIFHESGTEIVELPPRYPQNASQSDVRSEGQTRTDNRSDGSRTDSQLLAVHEPRQPAPLRKSPRLR